MFRTGLLYARWRAARAWREAIHPAYVLAAVLGATLLGASWAWIEVLVAADPIAAKLDPWFVLSLVAFSALAFFPAVLMLAWRLWVSMMRSPAYEAMSAPEAEERARLRWMAVREASEIELELGEAGLGRHALSRRRL